MGCTWLSRSQRGCARVDVSPEEMGTFRYQAICFAIHHGVVWAALLPRRGIVFMQLSIVYMTPGKPRDFCKCLCMDWAMPFPLVSCGWCQHLGLGAAASSRQLSLPNWGVWAGCAGCFMACEALHSNPSFIQVSVSRGAAQSRRRSEDLITGAIDIA